MYKISVVMLVTNERAKEAIERVKAVAGLYSDDYSVRREDAQEKRKKGDKR